MRLLMDLFGVPHLTISKHNFDIVNHIIPEGGPMGSRIGRNMGGTILSHHICVRRLRKVRSILILISKIIIWVNNASSSYRVYSLRG